MTPRLRDWITIVVLWGLAFLLSATIFAQIIIWIRRTHP
jgi:hypothetical protein